MRLGQTNRLVIMAGILAVVLAVLAWLQSSQEEVKDGLVAEMALASQRVANLNTEGLEAKLIELEGLQREASANASELAEFFAEYHEGIDVSEALYPLAKECRVNLHTIVSPGLTAAEFEETPNTGLPMMLTVFGEVSDIIDFITRLHETYPFVEVSTVTLNNVFGLVEQSSADNYTTGAFYGKAEATLNLVIYNYTIDDDSGDDGG